MLKKILGFILLSNISKMYGHLIKEKNDWTLVVNWLFLLYHYLNTHKE